MATSDIVAIVLSAPDVADGDSSWVATLVTQAQAAIAAFCNLTGFPGASSEDGGGDTPEEAAVTSMLEAICAQIALEAYRATSLAPESYDDPAARVARAAESLAVTLGRYKGLLARFRRLTL
jgi:hypothetical protein